jgi:hypothetical protein
VPTLKNLDETVSHQIRRIPTGSVRAPIENAPAGDLALVRAQQSRDGLQGGGLTSSVGAEERNYRSLAHRKRHTPKGEDGMVVDGLDVLSS